MKRVVHVALVAACLGGCGSSAPPSRPATSEVVVPQDEEPPDEPGSPDSPQNTPSRTAAGGDIEACARGLRDGEGVQHDDGRELYVQALGAERASDLSTARKSYFNLIQNHPKSGLVPLAYLAFGEIFRAEAESDPSKSMLAVQSYREVVKYPPPENIAYAYALLRVADVEAKSDPPNALNDNKKAIEAGKQFPNQPCSQVIAADARKKLTIVYAQVGQPSKAWQFFQIIAGDAAAAEMTEELTRIYQRENKSADACSAAQSASKLADLAREVCKKP